MKNLLFISLLVLICLSINGQSTSQIWKKRVDTNGTPPTKERRYVYEDKMNAWLAGNKWIDEIVSIKEIWYIAEKPGDSHWLARIQTKKAITPFYVEYDPANETLRSEVFWVIGDLLPANYKKYIDEANAKYEANESAAKKEKEDSEAKARNEIYRQQDSVLLSYWVPTAKSIKNYFVTEIYPELDSIYKVTNLAAVKEKIDAYKNNNTRLLDTTKLWQEFYSVQSQLSNYCGSCPYEIKMMPNIQDKYRNLFWIKIGFQESKETFYKELKALLNKE